MTNIPTEGSPPKAYSKLFAPESSAKGANETASANSQENANRVADATIDGASVFLNPDGSVTVTSLKDNRGFLHTVYIPVYRQASPGQSMTTLIDGLPLNPISNDHLWLAKRARAIGQDTQLRSGLKDINAHECKVLEAMANAIINKQEEKAKQLFRTFRHTQISTNNFYKLVKPLTTMLMMLRTPPGYLIDPYTAQVGITYTVTQSGAVLSVCLGRSNFHLWSK